ncbi:hypothetical protein IV55_GL000705 [Furfurilactobacillus siliginis]|nr:hypothetical protein IV55_GL000705 [Furfurilactobacillus siliginis]
MCINTKTNEVFEGMRHMHHSEIMRRINEHSSYSAHRTVKVDLPGPLMIVKEN